MSADLLQRAVAAHREGRLQEAEALYRAALAVSPEQPDAIALLGVLCGAKGATEEALRLAERAVVLDPSAALFHFYLGNAAQAAGALERAVVSFREALSRDPRMAEAWYNLGNALSLQKKWDEAEKAYASCLSLAPAHLWARNNRALLFEKQKRLESALAAFKTLVAEAPAFAEAWKNLSNVAEQSGAYGLAEEAGRRAASLAPEDAACWFGLGVALSRLEQHAEAADVYEKALALGSDWALWDNLGQTLQYLDRFDEADAAYRKMIALEGQTLADAEIPICDEAKIGSRHWHLALLELLRGDLLHGFARYRARVNAIPALKRPPWKSPLWKGEDLSGKTILVYDEQGFGDSLMMARYLPLLKARGARVFFLAQKPLVPYLKQCAFIDRLITRDEPFDPAFDCYASLFDLPYLFKTELATIPAEIPYLPVPDAPPHADFRVGVVWAGTPKHKHDARRSLPLAVFADLFSVPGISFISLNRDKRDGDDALLAKRQIADLAPALSDFAALAEKIAEMDLIVSCDTATAHLAGAMGKEVWVLLPFIPDWRWLLRRADSPWYPTARLFRQEKAGDWTGVLEQVKAALEERKRKQPRACA
jgi:tetratricopeptide (TPR) repeat protein